MNAFTGGISNQFIHIGALQRIATRENEDRNVHFRNLIDEPFRFGIRQLVRMRNGLGSRAAVLACQIAGLGYLPNCQKGRLVVVDIAAGGDTLHHF